MNLQLGTLNLTVPRLASTDCHDCEVVVLGRPGAEVGEVAETCAYEFVGQKLLPSAEYVHEPSRAVLFACGVARFGEAVGEEEERVAGAHGELCGGEHLPEQVSNLRGLAVVSLF